MHQTAPLQLELTISLRGKNKPCGRSKAWASSGATRLTQRVVLSPENHLRCRFQSQLQDVFLPLV